MKPYQPPVPRTLLALTAAALSSVTFALLVIAPSRMEPESRMFFELARLDIVSSMRCSQGPDRGECPGTARVGDGPLAQSRGVNPPPRCDRSG